MSHSFEGGFLSSLLGWDENRDWKKMLDTLASHTNSAHIPKDIVARGLAYADTKLKDYLMGQRQPLHLHPDTFQTYGKWLKADREIPCFIFWS